MPTTTDFTDELDGQIDRAMKQGRSHIEVNAGELHRLIGGYPGDGHRMPMCCEAMRQKAKHVASEIIFEPPSGQGASLTIRYSW